MNDFNDPPLPKPFSPFRRAQGGPPTNADFMDRFGYDGSCPPASMTFPGGFMSAEWSDYESRTIAERAFIEGLVPTRDTWHRTPRIEFWTPPPLISATPVPFADLQPDHDAAWPGSELRMGVGVADTGLCDDPTLWKPMNAYWSSVVIARPGQFLAGMRRAVELRLGGDPRVILVCDSQHPEKWIAHFHERQIWVETWNE
ncbi:hypothetical protein [Acidiphilium sp.]|uniref:hypothetical protein n=1 Tax=Acidiphilium sp. TaxID=527 RepID=UPI00258BA0F6|nr:hypothetical protein [Acidiphilium sp.]